MKRFLPTSPTTSTARTLLVVVNQLLSSALTHVEREQLVEQAELVLASMPLDTATYGLAQCRLQNAARYLRGEEPGAARFELKQFLSAIA